MATLDSGFLEKTGTRFLWIGGSLIEALAVADFEHYIGIDYSGALTADCGLPGLRIFAASHLSAPKEVTAEGHWSRRAAAHWLAGALTQSGPAIVGVDHGFSFPLAYFEEHGLRKNWREFLRDFCAHWPTGAPGVRVEDIRRGRGGRGVLRGGSSRWRRVAEVRAGAKSVFHFDVPGSVAKSTHAGLPWLEYLDSECGERVHFWPFDGWAAPSGKSLIAEVYPSLWKGDFPCEGGTQDQRDAYAIARWLREADADGRLSAAMRLGLRGEEQDVAAVEGWILGVA